MMERKQETAGGHSRQQGGLTYAKLEASSMHVVCKRLHAVWERLGIGHDLARDLVARDSPAVIYADVLVADFVEAILDELVGDSHHVASVYPPAAEIVPGVVALQA
jgi:hypothetical protein